MTKSCSLICFDHPQCVTVPLCFIVPKDYRYRRRRPPQVRRLRMEELTVPFALTLRFRSAGSREQDEGNRPSSPQIRTVDPLRMQMPHT